MLCSRQPVSRTCGGIPAGEVGKATIAGTGGVLGSVTIIIGARGAMLGRTIPTLWWCRVTG
ncbi:hypothetical protein ACLK1T_19420 [Escherichia coli]